MKIYNNLADNKIALRIWSLTVNIYYQD